MSFKLGKRIVRNNEGNNEEIKYGKEKQQQ